MDQGGGGEGIHIEYRRPAVQPTYLLWIKVFLLPETPIQQVEAVEVVTTEVTEEDKSSSPLPQSPPAEKSVGPSVPESREVKSRSVNTKFL